MSGGGRLAAIAVAAFLGAALWAPPAGAHRISKRAAERSAFRTVSSVARQTGAVLWYAGICKAKSAHRRVCWGAVIYESYEGCAQQIDVRSRGHSRRLRARRIGRVYCDDLSEEIQENSGSSSGTGGEWAICGIRSSVCIGS